MKVCGQTLALAKFGKAMIKNFLRPILIVIQNSILKQCIEAGRTLSPLTRICKFMSLKRWKALMKSHFVYRPLVWMCCDKTCDNCIKHLTSEH